MKKPYIVYSLSKGRTTQKFNKTKFKDILKDIDVFLQSFTMKTNAALADAMFTFDKSKYPGVEVVDLR